MIKFVIALVLVIAVVLSAFTAMRKQRAAPPPQDVLERVKVREREIEAREGAEGKD